MSRIAPCVAAILIASVPPAAVAEAAPAGGFLAGAKVGVEARYRLELVDQDGLPDDAEANTLRLRLTLASGAVSGWSVTAEADGLAAIGSEHYNSTRNGNTSYPVVADPPALDLNQLFVQYAGWKDTTLRLGRQRLRLDNERFIGSVGWRQNEQTFDAFSIETRAVPRLALSYAYVDTVRRVFGPDAGSPPAAYEGSSHLFNAKYSGLPIGNLVAYDYHLSFDNAAQLSSNTLGLRLDGSRKLGESVSVSWALEYAQQSDVGSNPASIDADYSLLEAGLKHPRFGITLGQEILGGESGTFTAARNPAFQTPLATLHKFQGWADKFLTTPSAGVVDRYVAGSASVAGFTLQAVWHDYGADAGSADYGSEWNLSVGRKFAGHYDVLVKYADYSADALYTDTTKFWLMVTAAW